MFGTGWKKYKSFGTCTYTVFENLGMWSRHYTLKISNYEVKRFFKKKNLKRSKKKRERETHGMISSNQYALKNKDKL